MSTQVYTSMICSTLTFIEANLDQSLPLATLAKRSKCSPYHFHRLFSATTGWRLASYVRARRLTRAAHQLLETDETVLMIALNHGFDSQAAFARAFKKQFGIAPTQLRLRGSVTGLRVCFALTEDDLKHLAKESINMEPTITKHEQMTVIGMSTTFVPEEDHDIPQLWQRFMSQAHTIENRRRVNACFGVSMCEGEHFRYIAGVAVEADTPVPEGMESVLIPAQDYAVFTHKGTLESLPQTMQYIFSTWLSNTHYTTTDSPDFELYDERYIPNHPDSAFDIYVPIVTEQT